MNFTGGKTLPNLGKRINWHIITLAIGLATAISIVGVLRLAENDTTQAPTTVIREASAPAATATVSKSTTRPQLIIVESHAQANQLAVLMAEEQRTAAIPGYESPLPSFMVIASPDEQNRYGRILAEQMEFGTFDILDLRSGANSVASPASSSAPSESSAETRPVLYIVESAEQQATVSAALETDRMAAVLAGNEVPFRQTSFFIVSSLAEERALTELQMERLLLPNPTSDIIDLRN